MKRFNYCNMTNYLNTDIDINPDKSAGLYDELPFWAAPFGLKLLDNIKLKKNMTVLDIGFGTGFPLTELAMRLGNSSKIYGIDPWEQAIKRAESKIEYYGINNVEIIRGVAENIPLEDNSVDLITSNNGINNVSDVDKVMSGCARIMKKGGQFVMTINLDKTMIEFYDIMEIVLKELKMEAELIKMQKQIYKKRKPLTEYKNLIEQHGFSVVKVIHDQFDYKFVDGTTMLNHYFIRLSFLDGWKSIFPTKKQDDIFKKIENYMNEKAYADGFFKLSVPFALIDCEKK
ncbi:MAG: methyltransferase domain-containing protein [Bacteroidota bacterium]